jgi:uncharacterized protein YjdB
VSTGNVSDITTSTAKVTGTVSDLGNIAGVTQHGHTWSTSPSPSVNLYPQTTLGTLSQTASYTSNLANLSPNTTYYVRAYATNAVGTAYGNELSFKTPATPPAVSVTSVSLNPTSLALEPNGTAQLTATVYPADAANQAVSWSSSNTSVATVSNGLVTARSAGTADITVTTADGNKTATCNVTVTIPVTSVSLNQTSLALEPNGTAQLTATVNPANATNQAVSWSSSNTSVATVSNGLVTARSAGTATITVTTADGNKTATCVVIVSGIGGTFGSSGQLTWSLVNGTLTIGGTGAMPYYFYNDFSNCPWYNFRIGIMTVDIQNGVTTIGGYAFYECSILTSITIPNSVTSIGRNAFYNCSVLTSITIPNSVTSIGDQAFYYCSSLTSITIPNSVTSIGDWAFDGCSSLKNVTVLSTTPFSIGSSTFGGAPLSSATLYVPKGWKVVYQNAPNWKDFGNIVELN